MDGNLKTSLLPYIYENDIGADMKKRNQTRSKDIALTGILLGLCLLFLWLASVDIARFANLYLAVLLPLPLVFRGKKSMAWLLWLGATLLAMFLLPDKNVALAYCLVGYYLMLREGMEGRVVPFAAVCVGTIWLALSASAYLWIFMQISGLSFNNLLPEAWHISPLWLAALGVFACFGVILFTDWLVKAIIPLIKRLLGD